MRQVPRPEDERVVLECVQLVGDFADIRDYVLAKGGTLLGYQDGGQAQKVLLRDIMYFEAVGELVFGYTAKDVYQVKQRLYEVEQAYAPRRFVRVAKALVVNLLQVESFRPALNGRLYARMRNGEDVIVSRQYAKALKQAIMSGGAK